MPLGKQQRPAARSLAQPYRDHYLDTQTSALRYIGTSDLTTRYMELTRTEPGLAQPGSGDMQFYLWHRDNAAPSSHAGTRATSQQKGREGKKKEK